MKKICYLLCSLIISAGRWQSEYLMGTGCEMYTETLSSSFIGMSFSQAAETCFVKVMIWYITSN